MLKNLLWALPVLLIGLTIGVWWNPFVSKTGRGIASFPASSAGGAVTTISGETRKLAGAPVAVGTKNFQRSEKDRQKALAAVQRLESVPETKELSKAFLAFAEWDGNPDTRGTVQEEFRKVVRDPVHGLRAIEAGLARLPRQGMVMERLSILETAGLLVDRPEARAALKKLMQEELATTIIPQRPDVAQAKTQEQMNQALSTTVDMALPQVALGVYLKSCDNPAEAIEGTIHAIEAQKEPYVRDRMAEIFILAQPGARDALVEKLAQRGITVRPVAPVPAEGT